jgi:hypothetical protein
MAGDVMATLIFVSGWLSVGLVGVAVLIPAVVHVARRRRPARRVLRIHYVVGWAGGAMVVTHGVASVVSGALPVSYVIGLWAGSATLWLVCIDVALGVALIGQRGSGRMRTRHLHVLLTPVIVAAAATHVALNWQLVVTR